MARVDKWLWSVRLAKTRSSATQDCNSGRIKRDGTSLKPSAKVKQGDILHIPSPDRSYQRTIEVKELLEKRVGAPIAREAYEEQTPETILNEAAQKQQFKRAQRSYRKEGDQGRMTKRNRRQWKQRSALIGQVACLPLASISPVFAESEPDSITAKLASENFSDRKEAQEKLYAWAWSQEHHGKIALYTLYQQSKHPETRARIRATLNKILIQENSKGYMGIIMGAPVFGRPQVHTKGVIIQEVLAKGPADLAGLISGDLITRIDDLKLDADNTSAQLSDYVKSKKALTKIKVFYERDGKEGILTVQLADFTESYDPRMGFSGELQRPDKNPVEKWMEAQSAKKE